MISIEKVTQAHVILEFEGEFKHLFQHFHVKTIKCPQENDLDVGDSTSVKGLKSG